MKKLLLIPALLSASLALATEYNYEITPVVGYDIAEGNLDLENQWLVGAEAQLNNVDSAIKPELSLLYTNTDYDEDEYGSTNIYRIALNGVYEFDKLGIVTPLAKAGIGYETLNRHYEDNYDSGFVDAGIGAKIPFSDNIALKMEAVYMLKNNNNRWDNNLALLAGLNIAFGAKAAEVVPVAAAVVDGDDDNDGVLNSKDKCPKTPAGTKVDADGCTLILDSDNDGVNDTIDKCPNTPAGTKVDANGCKLDLDKDKDGVLDSKDICPNTPLGEAVNSDGCPATVNLNINFENNSAKVDTASKALISTYATFLKKHTNYSAKIVGYTDSRGRASYNQKLSQKRADAVVNQLVADGVDAKQLSAEGMGENNPIADNSTAEGRAKNRRIEAELTRH